jgi:hypothetical protein
MRFLFKLSSWLNDYFSMSYFLVNSLLVKYSMELDFYLFIYTDTQFDHILYFQTVTCFLRLYS